MTIAEVLLAHGITLAASQRAELAADLLDAIVDPQAVAKAIRESARFVLTERNHAGALAITEAEAERVAREIGNNAAGSVLLELAVPEVAC